MKFFTHTPLLAVIPLMLSGCVTTQPGSIFGSSRIEVPSNVDYTRLRMLEDPSTDNGHGLMKVYVIVKYNGKNAKDADTSQLLISQNTLLSKISGQNFRQTLLNAIDSGKRFKVFNHESASSSEIPDDAIRVEGRITDQSQKAENLGAAYKVQTRVQLSINITGRDQGQVLLARTCSGYRGNGPGNGTVLPSLSDIRKLDYQENLYDDYAQALNEAITNAADFVKARYRPVGRVMEVQGNVFAMKGGSNHGFNGNDDVVVFRTKFSIANGRVKESGIITGIAKAHCNTVTDETSTCTISAQDSSQPAITTSDYVVLANPIIHSCQ